jgi:hypothetical protein
MGERVKKPEITEDYLCEAWIGETKFCTTTHAAGKP